MILNYRKMNLRVLKLQPKFEKCFTVGYPEPTTNGKQKSTNNLTGYLYTTKILN